MNSLTTTDMVLAFIIRHKREHDGNSPSFRQIMNACCVGSTSVVEYHLNRLEDKGFIRRVRTGKSGAATSIEVIGGKWMEPEKAQLCLEAQ
jgi:SOS-response transcriptional repressor LexA